MLNKTEYKGTVICVLPVGVEVPRHNDFPKSSRKKAPKYESKKVIEETIECANGLIMLKGSEYEINEIYALFYDLGFLSEEARKYILLDEIGRYHVFGDYKGVERVWKDFKEFDIEVSFSLAYIPVC